MAVEGLGYVNYMMLGAQFIQNIVVNPIFSHVCWDPPTILSLIWKVIEKMRNLTAIVMLNHMLKMSWA